MNIYIDSGLVMPEPAHVERNRQAARAFDGRPVGPGQRFNEAKYRAERGGYKRFAAGYSKRGEKPAPLHGPMPLDSRKLWGAKNASRIPNGSTPSSDLKALNADWFERNQAASRAP